MREKTADFKTVTETPDARVSQEQLQRLYTRYKFALKHCIGKDVLEVACGAGIGLGYLAKAARKVVGGDIDPDNLAFASRTYQGRLNIEVKQFDAHQMPFEDGSFDVVIIFEAIYYFSNPALFVDECRRVLRKDGTLLICTVNKEWPGFNPSPFSVRYFSAEDLYLLLEKHGFEPALFAGSKADESGILSAMKRFAVRHGLMPKTMKGKEILRRLFQGKLHPMPAEAYDGMAEYDEPMPISADAPETGYKIIYAVGHVI